MKPLSGLCVGGVALAAMLAVGSPHMARATDPDDRRVVASDPTLPETLIEALQSVVFVDVFLATSATSVEAVNDGGTGILVAPCPVLTPAHLPGKLAPGETQVRAVSVRFTQMEDEAANPVTLPATVEEGRGGTLLRDPLLDDWVLLRLDSPAPVAPLAMASADCCSWYRIPRSAATGGYPVDKLDRSAIEMWVDPACRIQVKLANSMLATNCQATSGNSGGPVLVSEAGRWKLAGMITRAPPPAPGRLISDTTSYAISIRGPVRSAIAQAEAAYCPPAIEDIEDRFR